MRNTKLNCVEVGEGEEKGSKVVAIPEGKLKFWEITHHPEEEHPVQGDCHVETDSEENVIGLEVTPLLLGGVTSVLSEDLIKEW